VSRLDSVIRRLEAQRACLELAAGLIAGLDGMVFELGLGNGRTYDHLRAILPAREIVVFERQISPRVEASPDPAQLILGDIHDTLPRAVERFGGTVALVHADIGTGVADANARIAGFVARYLPALLCRGGIVVSDQEMAFAGAQTLPLPDGVAPGRYNIYRAG
jgi:hypothetical protein